MRANLIVPVISKFTNRKIKLTSRIEEELLKKKDFQAEMKKVFRKGYNTDYEDYVCVDATGKLYNPDFITEHFNTLLERNGMRHIRFHELRYSCASLLLTKYIPMKMIQD